MRRVEITISLHDYLLLFNRQDVSMDRRTFRRNRLSRLTLGAVLWN